MVVVVAVQVVMVVVVAAAGGGGFAAWSLCALCARHRVVVVVVACRQGRHLGRGWWWWWWWWWWSSVPQRRFANPYTISQCQAGVFNKRLHPGSGFRLTVGSTPLMQRAQSPPNSGISLELQSTCLALMYTGNSPQFKRVGWGTEALSAVHRSSLVPL